MIVPWRWRGIFLVDWTITVGFSQWWHLPFLKVVWSLVEWISNNFRNLLRCVWMMQTSSVIFIVQLLHSLAGMGRWVPSKQPLTCDNRKSCQSCYKEYHLENFQKDGRGRRKFIREFGCGLAEWRTPRVIHRLIQLIRQKARKSLKTCQRFVLQLCCLNVNNKKVTPQTNITDRNSHSED